MTRNREPMAEDSMLWSRFTLDSSATVLTQRWEYLTPGLLATTLAPRSPRFTGPARWRTADAVSRVPAREPAPGEVLPGVWRCPWRSTGWIDQRLTQRSLLTDEGAGLCCSTSSTRTTRSSAS